MGASGIASHYLSKLRRIADVQVKWIYSRSLHRAEQFSKDHDISYHSDHLEDLLADDTVQAVLILNEPARHLPTARLCLQAGKHLLIEKPLAVDLDEAQAFQVMASSQKAIVSVISPYRFNPILQEMKGVLELVGQESPKSVLLSLMWSRDQRYYEKGDGWRKNQGAVLLNQGIHWLDVLNWFFGQAVTVSAISRSTRPFLACPDQSSALIAYRHGVSVSLAAGTFTSHSHPDQFTIYHGKGRLDYQTLLGPAPPPNIRTKLGRLLLSQPRWGRELPDAMHLQLMDFLTAIRDQAAPSVTLADGCEALKLALALNRTTM